jgi:hypothetical protein
VEFQNAVAIRVELIFVKLIGDDVIAARKDVLGSEPAAGGSLTALYYRWGKRSVGNAVGASKPS